MAVYAPLVFGLTASEDRPGAGILASVFLPRAHGSNREQKNEDNDDDKNWTHALPEDTFGNITVADKPTIRLCDLYVFTIPGDPLATVRLVATPVADTVFGD